MERTYSGYHITCDPDATRAFYQDEDPWGCDCLTCRNFMAAAPAFPQPVQDFFAELGLDVQKPAEIYDIGTGLEEGCVNMAGFYHLCGTLLEKPEDNSLHPICDGFSVWFGESVHLLESCFPEPVVQLEIDFRVPWVLEERSEPVLPLKKQTLWNKIKQKLRGK